MKSARAGGAKSPRASSNNETDNDFIAGKLPARSSRFKSISQLSGGIAHFIMALCGGNQEKSEPPDVGCYEQINDDYIPRAHDRWRSEGMMEIKSNI